MNIPNSAQAIKCLFKRRIAYFLSVETMSRSEDAASYLQLSIDKILRASSGDKTNSWDSPAAALQHRLGIQMVHDLDSIAQTMANARRNTGKFSRRPGGITFDTLQCG